MEVKYPPRPDDFRLAWANAYQQAMVLAIEIHRRNDELLFRSDAVMTRCDLFSEQARDNLRRTGQIFVDEMRKSGAESKKSINLAADQFLDSMKASLARDRNIRDEIGQEVQALVKERQSLEKLKASLNARPLWERLWLAFHRRY